MILPTSTHAPVESLPRLNSADLSNQGILQKNWILHKRHCGLCLSPFWVTHSLWKKSSCHDVRRLKQWYGEVLKAPTNNSTTFPSTWVSHLESRSSSPSHAFRWKKLRATSWLQSHDTLIQNHPAKTPLDSWHTETVWNSTYCFKTLTFKIICYKTTGNWHLSWEVAQAYLCHLSEEERRWRSLQISSSKNQYASVWSKWTNRFWYHPGYWKYLEWRESRTPLDPKS